MGCVGPKLVPKASLGGDNESNEVERAQKVTRKPKLGHKRPLKCPSIANKATIPRHGRVPFDMFEMSTSLYA